MPLRLVPAIALHEVVEAESCSPKDTVAVGTTGSVLFEDRYLTIVYEEVAVGQQASGTLCSRVNGIGRIGEIVSYHRRGRFIWWNRQLKCQTDAWMSTGDAWCVEVVEVRNDHRGVGDFIRTWEVLPRLKDDPKVSECHRGKTWPTTIWAWVVYEY